MSCGSRELLLALGFAMNKNNLLYEMIQNKIEATPINPKYSFLPTPIRKSMRCENEMFESKDQKAMQWIKGRTNITKRLCCETQNKINKLLKQVSDHKIYIKQFLFNIMCALVCIFAHFIPI